MNILLMDCLYLLLTPVLLPWLLYRMLRYGRYRRGWRQKLGSIPRRHTDRPCIWIHAVSLGEINAIETLLAELQRLLPAYEIVISTTTDTGMARARQRYGPKHRVFFFPLDFSWAVKRSFTRIHPQLCILMEGEVWPNFTALAQQRKIPLVVANARVGSGKGWPRYRRVAPLVRPIFRRLSLVLVQDLTHAQRFQFLGVQPDRLRVVGTLKYDTAQITDNVPGSDELRSQLHWEPKPPLWVAGQTGPGEEQIVLDVFEALRQTPSLADLRLVLVPRKPERFDEVARLIDSRKHPLVRYSRVKTGEQTVTQGNEPAVILGDTLGDLRKFYCLADVVFVGRSLVPMGGSDVMEVAALAKPLAVGPHTENFTETINALTHEHALAVVADQSQLLQTLKQWLLDPYSAAALAQRARQVVQQNKGATTRTVAEIVHLLGYQMPLRASGIAYLTVPQP